MDGVAIERIGRYFFMSGSEFQCCQQIMCQRIVRGEYLVYSESETKKKLRYVALAVQSLHECNGQGGESECIGLRFTVVRTKWA